VGGVGAQATAEGDNQKVSERGRRGGAIQTASTRSMAINRKMAKVIVVAGYGPSISHSVAKAFEEQGFTPVLLSRTQAKLDAALREFKSAKAYAVDLSLPKEVIATIEKIQHEVGRIHILFWNPYGASKGLDATPEDFQVALNLTTVSLNSAVVAALPSLEANKGAVLITGGGLSLDNSGAAEMAANWKAHTLAVSKASQRKLGQILHAALKPKGVYVGEVTVMGMVKGTPFDAQGKSNLTPESIAEEFVKLNKARDVYSVNKA